MPDNYYNKNMLDEHFRQVGERFDDQNHILDEIKVQTTLHNGRMSKLESWQSFMRGGLAVITIILLPILFILIQLYLKKQSP